MHTRIVALLVAAALGLTHTAHAAPGFVPSGAGAGHWSWGLLRLPLFTFRARPHQEPEPATPLQRSLGAADGWSLVGFTEPMNGSGCYLKVVGKAEFDRAEVLFADGELRTIELGGARRGKGVYELALWDEPREVRCVRMRARAHSSRARIELLFRR